MRNKWSDEYKNPPKVKVITKAESVNVCIQAIIAQHLVCNWPDDGEVTLLHRMATKMLLEEFDVYEKGQKPPFEIPSFDEEEYGAYRAECDRLERIRREMFGDED